MSASRGEKLFASSGDPALHQVNNGEPVMEMILEVTHTHIVVEVRAGGRSMGTDTAMGTGRDTGRGRGIVTGTGIGAGRGISRGRGIGRGKMVMW